MADRDGTGAGAGVELGAEAGKLLGRIEGREAVFGVVGLGYVGLPLSVAMTNAGFRVLGIDVAEGVVEALNAGRSHVEDVAGEVVASMREGGLFEATTDASRLAECDIISICVPTPLGKTRDPDVSYVVAASEAVAAVLRPGQLIILESTTYPGTTREVLLPLLEIGGLKVGRDFFLCFSPERVDPGNPVWKVHNTPKVVGGITPTCSAMGRRAYESVLERVVAVSSTEAAELSKLLENTFRSINIALVNEMAQVADRLDVDVWEVIDAAATKPFGFMRFTPGPGIGGHCIPLDPQYLSWKMKTLDYRTRLIEVASEINAEMPRFVVGKVGDALNEHSKPVRGSRILVLGTAYKKDVGDIRESPALDIIRVLAGKGADVRYHDPFVPRIREDGIVLESVPLTDAELAEADCVVIVTDHSTVDYAAVVREAALVVDTRNATGGITAPHVVRLSGPRPFPRRPSGALVAALAS
ncbi:MAG TPA: nucleotide sugar dehydrogenase [Longimicrobiales bacterium]|nr:nucleotide sugar dehydrogenase [Longimicrobiales bacterium]